MKRLLLLALAMPAIAFAQIFPSPTFSSLTLQTPLTAANGGTGSSTSTGTGSVVLSTGPTITGSFTATGLVTTADLAAQAANTVLANVTGSAASPTAFAIPSCSTSTSALQYTSGTGFSCYTSSASLAGSTFTGASGLSYVSPTFTINDSTGANAGYLNFNKSGVQEWSVHANSAGGLYVDRYVSGTYADTPLSISSANGTVGMGDGIVNSPISGSSGSFTTLAASSTVSGAGFTTLLSPYAPLASPALTGAPTAPTAAFGTNTTQLATTGFVAASLYDGNVINVVNYGAVGNSNGTHGNGTDSTTAFQNAMNAATGGSLFIPCGTYRLTSTVTTTDGKPRYVYGHGNCTKIFNDATTAQPTFSFSPATGTCSSAQLAPCLVAKDLNFLPPNVASGAQSAFTLTNTNAPLFVGNTFSGQNVGIALTASYAPRVIGNQFIAGSYGVFSADISPNGAEIASNGFYGMSADAINISPTSGCAESPSIRNNDFEDNGVAVVFGGVCGGSYANNYEENLSTQVPFVFSGTTNAALSFTGNTINGSNLGQASVPITNTVGAAFTGNAILNTAFSYGTGARQIRIRASENTFSNTSVPATTVACTGYGTGGSCSLFSGDDLAGIVSLTTGTSPASTGSMNLTFTNALGPNYASCSWIPTNSTGTWSSPNVVGNSAAATGTTGLWSNSSVLTASKSYLLGYQCQGY